MKIIEGRATRLPGGQASDPPAGRAGERRVFGCERRATSDERRVLVGMSGGVDSSVAAALLKDEGHEVIGVSLNLLTCDRPIERSCCSARDREDARAVCEKLGIKHFVVDCRALFKDAVIGPFVEEYVRGRTPSPCILCNERVKFPIMIREAEKLGAEFIATGHYARILHNELSSYQAIELSSYRAIKLLRGADQNKDQSYFLFNVARAELARTIFPLGGMTKAEVRKIANAKGLATRKKPESQEVCFVPDDDYASFVESSCGGKLKGVGNFVAAKGNVLGRHRGIHAYTIGQRRGLGFGIGRRQYVVGIDPARNEVVLGSDADLMRSEIIVGSVTWLNEPAWGAKDLSVRIRSTHAGEAATVAEVEEGLARVCFNSPVRAPAPGQAAVFYRGDEVVGGGWIENSY